MKNNRFRNKKIGLIFLVSPIVLIFTILILFAVINVVVSNSLSSGVVNDRQVFLTSINFILSLLGLVGIVGVIVGIPIGIYYLVKKDHPLHNADKRSGKGDESEVPAEIEGWNWGAAGLTFVWGLYHRVWISLLTFLPIISLFFWIILGIKGNEWAWKKMQWESVEEFKKSQKKWKPWGIAFLVLNLVSMLIAFSFSLFVPPSSEQYGTTEPLMENQEIIDNEIN